MADERGSKILLGQNLIVNGDFEDNGLSGQSWLNQKENAITGWYNSAGSIIQIQKNNFGSGNATGDAIVELHSGAGLRLAQNVNVTEAGEHQFSFGLSSRVGSREVHVYVDGEKVGTFVSKKGVFVEHSLSVDLSVGEHVIEFRNEYSDARWNTNSVTIDDVALQRVYSDDGDAAQISAPVASASHDEQADAGLIGPGAEVLGEELIVNGGFENHAHAGGTSVYFYGSIEGWHAAGQSKVFELQENNYGTGNKAGNAVIELDASRGSIGGISQTITVGEDGVYRLSFDYGNRQYNTNNKNMIASSNSIEVMIDGKVVQITSPADWKVQGLHNRTFDLELSAGTHELTFMEARHNPSTDDGVGGIIDNVSLRQVTEGEPETGALTGHVFFDADGDGEDGGNAGLAGKTVHLLDKDGAAVLDGNGEAVTATTGLDGGYAFADLAPGQYQIGLDDGAEPVALPGVQAVSAGKVTHDADAAVGGETIERTIEICENETFVEDFDTMCEIISEDVYFLMSEPVCANIGQNKFGETKLIEFNNWGSDAQKLFVFLDKPAEADLTVTVALTVDPGKVGVAPGDAGYAPDGFAYLTNQSSEIGAPRFETIEVLIRAGQTKSEAFYLGTEASSVNFSFGLEVIDIHNNDLDEKCELVREVSTTPIALDLNKDGQIGVTGETSSMDKTGVTIGETVKFDIDGDGQLDRVEWYDGSGDGILIDNRDGNAANDMDGNRLFGDANGDADGYAKLSRLFDANNDGVVEGAELNGLALWVDDGDAVVEAGEIQTLAGHSITSISAVVDVQFDADGRKLLRSTVKQDYEATGEVTYALEGPDAGLFTVDADGKVEFRDAPDFENPLDANGDNVYQVTLVRLTDDPTCQPTREVLSIEICDKPEFASFGDYVWFDADRDGVQDADETGVAGVTVTYTGAGDDGVIGTADDTTGTTVTDANGKYRFDNLAPGDYKATFVLPDGFDGFTITDGGPADVDGTDSDVDPITGMTSVFTLSAGEHEPDIDAGVVVNPQPEAAISGRYFCDENHNSLDNGDPGVANRTVTLLGAGDDGVFGTADDQTLATTTTAEDGSYSFTGLEAGDYAIHVRGAGFVTQNVDGDLSDDIDSDVNDLGLSGAISLAAGQQVTDIDAGTFCYDVPEEGLVGVAALQEGNLPPLISFSNGGRLNYDADTDALTVNTISSLSVVGGATAIAAGSRLLVDINVDENGDLQGGDAFDFMLFDDANGDQIADAGETVFLQGKVIAFGSEGAGSGIDAFDLIVEATGGTAASGFDPLIGFSWSSEAAGFSGEFDTDFSGEVKGTLGNIDTDCLCL